MILQITLEIFANVLQLFNEKNCDLKVPEFDKFNDEDNKILNNFTNNIENLRKFIDDQKLNSYVDFIINALFDANKYFNDQEPWKKKRMIKKD